jgi:transposase InsO family protein
MKPARRRQLVDHARSTWKVLIRRACSLGDGAIDLPLQEPSRWAGALMRFNFRADVVQVLERVGSQVDFPAAIRVDQGSEFVSRDLDLWAYQRNVTLDFSRPGKPTDNAFIESFNGKFRGECLNRIGS